MNQPQNNRQDRGTTKEQHQHHAMASAEDENIIYVIVRNWIILFIDDNLTSTPL